VIGRGISMDAMRGKCYLSKRGVSSFKKEIKVKGKFRKRSAQEKLNKEPK